MSLIVRHLYKFGEFRLDTQEKTLMRDDEHLELTQKAFELLTFFIENPGRLLKKDEIMEKIWAESFVEESNLTFNISQLRKILGDDAQQPIFIKTVRQHGYRFIAPVKEIVKEESPAKITEDLTPKPTENVSGIVSQATQESFSSYISKPNYAFVGLVVLLIAGLAGAMFLYGYFRNKTLNAPILSAPFTLENLSTNGKVVHAAISPDGKKVIYITRMGDDKQGIWLRQLEDGSNTNIIPPDDNLYAGITLSPDGETLYLVRRQQNSNESSSIYRVSVFGGIPQKIVNNTEGWISISPDGKKISFVRCLRQAEANCSLFIADTADGQNERTLDSRPRPFRIGDNQFSPDGKRIAFAVGQSESGANEFGIEEVDLETGAKREILQEKFFNIKFLVWLPDQSSLLMTARKSTETNFRIMQVSATTGETQVLTNDSEIYSVLSLDKKAEKLVCTKVKSNFRLQLINFDNPSDKRILADAMMASFGSDGKIYFSSLMSGNAEIWSINPDGSNQRQLTNNPADDSLPILAPDGRSLFFASSRTGVGQVWRMNSDGSNQTQITDKEGGFPLFVSSDGEWVYYHHGINRTLWRVSTKSGENQLVFNKSKGFFGISPDSTQVAYSETQGDERFLAISSLANGQTVKTFPLADPKNYLFQITWLSDGKSLLYVTTDREFNNYVLWLQSLDGNAPRQIANLGDEEVSGLSIPVSPDGKTLAIVQGGWLHDAALIEGLR